MAAFPKIVRACAVAVASLIVLAGAAKAVGSGPPHTGDAFAGEAAAIARASSEAHRIVSLVPATTEMLFAMGAGDRVAGVSSYDRYPPEVERLPRLGGLLDPNVERLLALKPDVAIVYHTQAELRQQLERAGIPVFPYAHRGLPDVTETIRALGARVGFEAQGRALAERIEGRLDEIRKRVGGSARPKVLLIFSRERGTLSHLDASGGYGFLHDMLEIAGAADVLADIKRESVQVSTEMVLTRAPDVIIELHYGTSLPPDRIEAERHVWDTLASVPAVKNGRVHLVIGDEFVVPGPRIAAATEHLARILHPDAFR